MSYSGRATPPNAKPDTNGTTDPAAAAGVPARRRPLIERIGMAAIALVLAALFGAVGIVAFTGGELFLAGMGMIGALMTLWVGGLTLFRG